jgi:two-component system phosphate regulon sensor histidine kinase PhoR
MLNENKPMRSSTIKWIILLSTIVIGLLVSTQLFWLNKIYNYEQKEFNTSVVKSIKGFYEALEITNSNTSHLQNLIEKPNSNTYLFRIDSIPQKDSLISNLVNNLEDFGVFADCKMALYSKYLHKYILQQYLPTAGTKHPGNTDNELTLYSKDYTYVQLYFPHRSQYILNEMSWWIASSVLLLIILIALGVSMFHLFRQKFLNEIQHDFIQNVTHEFQTPLTTLTVGLDIISKPSILQHPEKLEKYTRLMQGQTAYLKHHIDNLMRVLKTEANGLVMEKEMMAPNELIKNAVTQLYAAIEEKHANIQMHLEEVNDTIFMDTSSMYVAILNVISNAIKYSKNPLVIIETTTGNGMYRISVKDNGIGIAERYQQKLFKKFYRVPTGDVHNVKGLGLGLYFVKKVVTAHKGTITIKSIEDIGTEFIIELPKQ